MEYIVPLGILVAFLAWIIATFTRLHHLQNAALAAWCKWSEATQQRNACLVDFTVLFSGYLPKGDVRPRHLRRLADDTRRVLDTHHGLPNGNELKQLSHAEKSLRREVVNAVQAMEDSETMRDDTLLAELCTRVSVSIFQQDELSRTYNRSVGDFNMALTSPGARLVAGIFGFAPMGEL